MIGKLSPCRCKNVIIPLSLLPDSLEIGFQVEKHSLQNSDVRHCQQKFWCKSNFHFLEGDWGSPLHPRCSEQHDRSICVWAFIHWLCTYRVCRLRTWTSGKPSACINHVTHSFHLLLELLDEPNFSLIFLPSLWFWDVSIYFLVILF